MAKEYLPAGIGLIAVIPFGAEVLGVKEKAFTGIMHSEPVFPDFFGNGRRIFTEISCDVFEGRTRIETVFDVKAIFNCEMFMISRDIFAHDDVLSLLSGVMSIIRSVQK